MGEWEWAARTSGAHWCPYDSSQLWTASMEHFLFSPAKKNAHLEFLTADLPKTSDSLLLLSVLFLGEE